MAKITMEGLYRIWLKQSKNTKNKNLEALFINWMGHYKQAAAYYKANGHLNVPCTFRTTDGVNYDPKGFALGLWVRDQRSMRNAMRNGKPRYEFIPIKEKLLELIGMDWHPVDKNWEESLEIAKKYYKAHGNLDVSAKFRTSDGVNEDPNGFRLGLWIINLRNEYKEKKLSEKRINELNELKMIWDYNDYLWMKNYAIAKAFYEKHGHLKVQRGFKTKDGITYDKDGLDLCQWVRSQKDAIHGAGCYATNEKRIKLLDEIGMDWEYRLEKWYKAYALVRTYFNENGDIDVPEGFKTLNGIDYDENGIDIDDWIRIQRAGFKGLNDNYRKGLLREVGINGELKDKWKQNYLLAKAYFDKHHNLKISIDFRTKNGYERDPEGFKLGYWIQAQREAYKGKDAFKAKEVRIRLLDEIGMIWFSEKTNDKLLSETITDKNMEIKREEVLSRFYSTAYDLMKETNTDTLPDIKIINDNFVKTLKKAS